jgi:hypothetical protein
MAVFASLLHLVNRSNYVNLHNIIENDFCLIFKYAKVYTARQLKQIFMRSIHYRVIGFISFRPVYYFHFIISVQLLYFFFLTSSTLAGLNSGLISSGKRLYIAPVNISIVIPGIKPFKALNQNQLDICLVI